MSKPKRDIDAELSAAYPSLERLVEKAHELIAGQCSGKNRWRMTIPVHHNDHDILISAALDRQGAEIERLRAALMFIDRNGYSGASWVAAQALKGQPWTVEETVG